MASGIVFDDVRTSSPASEFGALPGLASGEVCDEEPYNNNDQTVPRDAKNLKWYLPDLGQDSGSGSGCETLMGV